MYKACLVGNQLKQLDYTFASGRKEMLEALLPTCPHVITESNWKEHIPTLAEVEFIFSTWGMVPFTKEQI